MSTAVSAAADFTLLEGTVIVLWILVIALGFTIFALARQLGVLTQRIAPAGALMVNQLLKQGAVAPELPFTTLKGDSLSTAPVGDKGLLLFFLAPDCPICLALLPVLKSIRLEETSADVFLFSDGDSPAEHEAFVKSQELDDFHYALSESVGRAFGVNKLPYAVLLDNDRTVVSMGIVNSREHLESLFEVKRTGIGSLQEYLAQRTVAQP